MSEILNTFIIFGISIFLKFFTFLEFRQKYICKNFNILHFSVFFDVSNIFDNIQFSNIFTFSIIAKISKFLNFPEYPLFWQFCQFIHFFFIIDNFDIIFPLHSCHFG